MHGPAMLNHLDMPFIIPQIPATARHLGPFSFYTTGKLCFFPESCGRRCATRHHEIMEGPSIKGKYPFAAQIKIIEITVADAVLAPVAPNGLEPVCKFRTQRQNVRPLVSAETGQVAIV